MPYIGRELERGTYLKLDDISSSFDGNKTIFNLTKGGDPFFPGSPQSIIVSLNGTILEPVTQYGIDSSKIVFATAPTAGHAFFSITLGLPFGVFDNGSIEDGSLTGFKLSNPFNYDNGLLFLNSLTDKVGIRTENPTHDLDVHGDVRIVGILTVGTSSLVLDGSNNKIQVGTALTLSHNDGAQIGNSHLHSTGYDLKTGAKIKLGDSGNLELFYSADGSFITHAASSAKLFINTNSSSGIEINKGSTENMAKFIPDGAVELYHGMGSGAGAEKKFNTTTTGATVTGKLVITGDLDVLGTTTTLDTTLTEVDKLEVGADNVTVGVAITQSGTGDALTIDDGNTRVFTVKDGGNVGIGTDNPDELLELVGTDPILKLHDITGGATHGFKLKHDGVNAIIHLQSAGCLTIKQPNGNTAANGIAFNTSNNDKERLRITGTGRVGIGTSVPKTQLHVYNGTPSDTGGVLVSNVSYDSNQDKPYLIVGTKSWTGANTNWNTFGFQHKIKVDSDGIPRLTIDTCLSDGTIQELFSFKTGANSGLGIGVTNPLGRLHLPDSGELRLGNDSDARLFHSGSHFLVNNYTGNTYLRINGTEDGIIIKPNDSVQLFHDNNLRFNTSADGVKVTGPNSGTGVGIGTTAGDDPLLLAQFNNGVTNNSQLRILSKRDTDGIDWTTSYTRIQQRIDVTDQAYIQFNGSDNNYGIELGTFGNEKFAKFIRNGAVELYHDNGQRFNTTAQGINVTTVGDVPQVAIAQTTTTAFSVNGTVSFVNSSNTTAQIQGRTGAASTTGDILFLCNTVGDETLAILEDGKVRVPDRGSFVVGQGNDLTLKHETNSTITNTTGQLAIENTASNISIKASNSTGDIIMRAGGGTSSENAIVAVHHGEVVLSFNGSTRLTTTNTGVDITDNLSVAGISTFSGNVKFSGDINVDSGKTLVLNSNTSDPVIQIQGGGPNFIRFASDASGTVDADSIDLVYRTTPNHLVFERASDAVDLLSIDADDGLVAITNNLNVTGGLDVDGATTLDGLTVSEAATFSADVTVGDGSADTRLLLKKADNDVSDHLQFYYQNTRMGEIGVEDTSWLRINQETNKNIYTPRYIRADAGFFVNDTTKGINGSGNFIGGTIAGASDYDTLLRSDTNDTMNGYINIGGSSVSGNEGGQINLTQAPNSTLDGTTVAIDQYINRIRFFEQGGDSRGAGIDFTRITGNPTDNEIFSSGLTGVGYTVTHLRSFGIPNGVVAISTSTQGHIPLTVTNSGGFSASTTIAKFVGNSDSLEVRNLNSGDYNIRVNSVNTGISFYNGGSGMQFLYQGSRKFSCINGGLSLNDELTFENDDEGVTTYAGGRFYKKNGGGIAIRQSSGNQTPIIESNNGTLQGTILHTGNIDDLDLPSGITITGANPTLNFTDSDTNADDFFIHVNSNKFYVLTDLDDDGASADDTSHHYPLVLDNANKKISSYGGPVLNEHQGFNPYDVVPAYSNTNYDSIRFNFTEMAMELSPPYGATDTQMGMAFPAFRVNTNTGEKFKLSVQIRSAASTSSGIYIRVYEYDAELPDGKTHVSNSASGVVQEDTRKKTISPTSEDIAGTTDWRTKTFTYTPTSTAVWASVVVLNWAGHGTTDLYVRDLKRELDLSSVGVSTANQIVLGNDSTGSNARRLVFASADTGTVTIQADTDGGATYTPSTGTITANNFSGSGSAISNVNAAKVVVSDESTDTTCHPLFATTNTGNAAVKVGSNLSFNSSSGALTATSFVGALTGAATRVTVTDQSADTTCNVLFTQAATGDQLPHTGTNLTFNSSTGKLTATSFSGTHTGARTGNHATDTGNRSTSGYVEAGRGGGGVALTINDGYGNSNLCFNHRSGVPDNTDTTQSSGRIECSVDSATANMYFELWDSVTEGTATGNAGTTGGDGQNGVQMHLTTTGVTINPFLAIRNELRFIGSDAELEFNTGGPRLRLSASNQLSFHSGGGLGSTNDERMRIDSSGLITMYNDLIVQAPSTTNQTRLHGGSIELNRDANDAFIDFKTTTSEDFDCRIQKNANQLTFYTGGNGSTQLTLDLKGNGNVEIPNGKLFVAQEVFFRNEFNLQGATTEATKHMDIGFEGHGFSMRRTTYNDQNHDIFLSVQSNGTTAISDVTNTSDAKLKKNVATIPDGAIENIKKLRPVKFDWIKNDKLNDNNGFIAQEFKEVFPNLVYGTEYDPTLIDEEKGTKGGIKSEGYTMSTNGLVAHLTKALQEAITKIETLEAEVTALKAKVG